MTKCASCSKSNATKTCSACKSVSYCNIKCQRNHWKTHKKKCKLLSKRNSKAKSKPQKDSEEKPISKDRNYRKIPITQNNQKNISAAQPLCSAVTLKERLNLLKQINDPEVESLVNILWKLYTNILNDGFSMSSQYKRLNLKQIKKQFSRYPIFIDLLYDAGFKKSSNGKKLIFDIKDMKLLMKANKELNKRFSFFGQFNDDKNDYNFDKRDSLHSRILDDLEMEMKDDIRRKTYAGYMKLKCYCFFDYDCHIVFTMFRNSNVKGEIAHDICHIISDFCAEDDDDDDEKYVYYDLKLTVKITDDLNLLMESWYACNLGNVDAEYIQNFCGKYGTIKEIDPDNSCYVNFANYWCHIPSDCCLVMDSIKDESVLDKWIFD